MIPVTTRMRYFKVCLLYCLISIAFVAKAQVWELGIQGGGAGYIGDLNSSNPLKFSGYSASGFVKANFDPNWVLGVHFSKGKIGADDAKSKNSYFKERNLSFNTSLSELSLILDFNFLDYFAGKGRKPFSPYLYVGFGAVFFTPTTRMDGETYKLASYRTEDVKYKTMAMALPFGAGVKYNVSDRWSVLANLGYRNAYTDYLDDVSQNYIDKSTLSSTAEDLLRKALSDRSGEKTGLYVGEKDVQRGDYRKRDTYIFAGVGITYTFVSQKCF